MYNCRYHCLASKTKQRRMMIESQQPTANSQHHVSTHLILGVVFWNKHRSSPPFVLYQLDKSSVPLLVVFALSDESGRGTRRRIQNFAWLDKTLVFFLRHLVSSVWQGSQRKVGNRAWNVRRTKFLSWSSLFRLVDEALAEKERIRVPGCHWKLVVRFCVRI